MIRLLETTVNEAAATPPNRTADAAARPEPVRTTVVPPVAGPELGVTEVRDGAGPSP